MKDAYEVLYKKEAELARVRREFDSLTIAAKLLRDDHVSVSDESGAPVPQDRKPAQSVASLESPVRPEGQPFLWPRTGFWSALKLRR
jgi:hypothetical protein